MKLFRKTRRKMLHDMVHDRAEPDAASVIQRVSRSRTEENYRLAARHADGKNILDIGPGFGIAYQQLLDAGPKRITCVDKFDQSRHHFSVTDSRIRHLGIDILNNDFADHQFDLIICVATLYYLTDHDAFLKEVDRLLAPGGILIINTFDKSVMQTLFGLTLQELDPYKFGPVYNGDEFARLIEERIAFATAGIYVQSLVRWKPWPLRIVSLITLPFRLIFQPAKLHRADGIGKKGVYTMIEARKASGDES